MSEEFEVAGRSGAAPVPDGAAAVVAAAADPMAAALLDSRQRWRDMVGLVADMAFETDERGRFVVMFPETVCGWRSATLLGQPAELLLADTDGGTAFNPFRVRAPVGRRRGWLRRPDGGTACLKFAATPILDAAGTIIGVRGVGQDVTEQETWDASIAAALRRGEVVDHILWRMRQEVLAPRMMQAALEALVSAMGADGAMVVDVLDDHTGTEVCHHVGHVTGGLLMTARTLLARAAADAVSGQAPDGELVILCTSHVRFGQQVALVVWRAAGRRAWDDDDHVLASSATAIVRVVLEHDAIQREMARQARTDPLTGLLNRRAFREEIGRRLDRLEREAQPATLMFVDLDNFKDLNDRSGHDVGDEALCLTATILRDTFRPADLVARLGGDEFAIWLDGADEFTAAERAEVLRVDGPRAMAHLLEAGGKALTMSIGIATRWPGRAEDIEALMLRADQAMYEVKRSGRGTWRVARTASE